MFVRCLIFLVCVVVSLCGAVAFAGVAQQAYVKASNTGNLDNFGSSVSISGDTLVVGARQEFSNATGVDGNQADNSAQVAGAAYVFVRTGGVWAQQAYLKASNTESNDRFGSAVAISGDTLVVGAPQEASSATGVNGNQADNSAVRSGAAYVFVRVDGVWSQQAYLKASNTGSEDQFGSAVAISGDTIVIGASLEDSSATGIDGNQGDNSMASAGAAYVFVRVGGVWTQQVYLKASNTGANDRFGNSVAISDDTVVVGAHGEASNATGVNGDQTNNNAAGSGAVYVFSRDGGVWSQNAYLKASNTAGGDYFGISISLFGNTLAVGAVNEASGSTGVNGDQANNSAGGSGAAYVFERISGIWSQQAYIKASNTGTNDQFGNAICISGNTLVVGAMNEHSSATGVNGDGTNDNAHFSGAAYVFVRNGTVWGQAAYLKSSNSATSDMFGQSATTSEDTIAVGAPLEDSNATGVNGNQNNNSAGSSGAVYVFTILSCPNLIGDMNCDCAVSIDDVYAFSQALLNGTSNPPCAILNGDMNSDGLVNGADIQGFVDLLIP